MSRNPGSTSPPRPTFFLIDAMSQIYRAFYAIKGLATKNGLPTNAVYGFVNMLLKIQSTYEPDLLCVVFDTEHPTFRHEAFEAYKAQRKPMPEELAEQLPYIRKACQALGIAMREMPGFEADDVIGTLAVKSRRSDFHPVIVSNDKDLYQLIGTGSFMLQIKKNQELLLDQEAVTSHFGVEPYLVPDVLGLWGDQSDNIPGVPGIGEKRAKELVGRFGTLDNILSSVKDISQPSIRKRLEEHRETALLSRELAVLRCDIDMEFEPELFRPLDPDRQSAYDLFTELEFDSLRKQFIPQSTTAARDYKTVLQVQELSELAGNIEAAGRVSVDTETDSTNPMHAKLVGISISLTPESGYYIPLGHDYPGVPQQISLDDAIEVLGPILENNKIGKIGQNIKYDLMVLRNHGLILKGITGDTMVASYLLDPTSPSHKLDDLALKHLNFIKIPYKEIAKDQDGKQTTLDRISVADVTPYAVEDAEVTLRLHNILERRLEEETLIELYDAIEIPLITVLADMEICGVKIDRQVLRDLGTRTGAGIEKLTEEIYERAGCKFNINSPAQLGEILFDKMKLPAKKRTSKQRRYSTDIEVLTELAALHDFPKRILEYRQLTKLKSTYIDALEELINPRTDRLHTSYNQTVTATGRLSSSEPNLQNIPIRTPQGREIRRAFVAEDGFQVVSCDYSQIELRILAHISGDEKLQEAFHGNEDIHSRTASELYDIPLEMITSDIRRNAKALNFGIIYGMSPFGLARELGTSRAEAQRIIDRYFDRYPGVKAFIRQSIDDVRETSTTRTLFNRVRYVPEINSSRASQRGFAERVAVNTPIQGTAADLIKVAMIRIHQDLINRNVETRMIMQVHDELVFEVPEDNGDEEIGRIVEMMENAHPLAVPLTVDVTRGKSWLGD
ncbi:DNA polymerase I [Acidobacteriota bacterium]